MKSGGDFWRLSAVNSMHLNLKYLNGFGISVSKILFYLFLFILLMILLIFKKEVTEVETRNCKVQ